MLVCLEFVIWYGAISWGGCWVGFGFSFFHEFFKSSEAGLVLVDDGVEAFSLLGSEDMLEFLFSHN